MMPSKAEQAFDAYTRSLVEEHHEWDKLPHEYAILGWDGDEIVYDTIAGIDPEIDPALIPLIMEKFAAEHISASPKHLPYAYALHFEAWSSRMAGAPPAEQPDREEIAVAICADINANVWIYEKNRVTGQVRRHGGHDHEQTGGRFTRTLLGIAARARAFRAESS